MPPTSSGEVSGRTRMTAWPALAASSARAESKMAMPVAGAGRSVEAMGSRSPRVWAAFLALSSNTGCTRASTCSGVTRMRASSREINPSLTWSTAILTAARAVRLPLRVCSIQSLPRSTVNSRSCISR